MIHLPLGHVQMKDAAQQFNQLAYEFFMHCLDQREVLEYHSNVAPPKDMELIFSLQRPEDNYTLISLRQYIVMLMTGQLFLRESFGEALGDTVSTHAVWVNYHQTLAGQNYGSFFHYAQTFDQKPECRQIYCHIPHPNDPADYAILEMFDCAQLKEHPYKLAYPRGARVPHTPFRIGYDHHTPGLEIKYPSARCSAPFKTIVSVDHHDNPVFAEAVMIDGGRMQFVVDLESVLDFLNAKPVHVIQAATTPRPVSQDTEL